MSVSMHSPACCDCGCETYRRSASAARKSVLKARGARRMSGRGMCSTCYARWQRSGGDRPLLDETVQLVAHPCVRCGITKRRENPLCSDCEEVVSDLVELETWVA